ncbi:MAG: hypothetical protein JSU04_11595 [Bdellovibrionales bacterium]|nr:hypothetical protein [Bdellovibrionales bacterium]
MKRWLMCLVLGSSVAHANLDLMQSSPSLNWHSIENQSVRLIYPDYLQAESIYIANLVEHYSQFVGQTYGIQQPKLFNLILRPEMALPNGYVTLAPRRSEWYASSIFFPYVGATEWYQTLSIHEYRHVNQFDYFNRNGTRYFYYFMGDMGEVVAVFLSLPSWYMEGDAVWAETKYTDAGRGRSPRFMARLKALVLSDRVPSYDEFLNGTYKTDLPNQYVYGYALISYATQKYGDDIWQRVIADVARFPNPFRLYSSFERVTGQSFEAFYGEAMFDLRQKWSADMPPGQEPVEYRDNVSPYKQGNKLYYIHQDLDSSPALMKEENGVSEKLTELVYSKDFMSMAYGPRHAVTTEFLPDARYAHKSSSDLLLINLKNGQKSKITSGQRLYNPSFNATENKIIATDFREDQSWNISEYDLQGNLLQTFSLPDMKVAEARYLDDEHAVAIVSTKTGYKSIVEVSLKDKKIGKTFLQGSRNLLYGIFVDGNRNLFFEAQYKGQNEIFRLGENGVARCTRSKLSSFTPSTDGKEVFYSEMDFYGTKIMSAPLAACESLPATELVDFNYLGNGPSDNYNKFPLQKFPEQLALYTKNADKYQPKPYGDLDRQLFIPHSWGFLLGRGGSLGVQTDNYLRTLSLGAGVGSSPEEKGSVVDFSFDFKKYYPLFSVQAEERKRNVKDFDTEDKTQWKEDTAGLLMVIPYQYKSGLYNFAVSLSGSGAYTNTKDYKFNEAELSGSNYFYKTSSSLTLAWSKDPNARSIQAPWAVAYLAKYDNAEQPSKSVLSSYRLFQTAILETRGFFKHDGFKLSYDQQKQGATGYRFLPEQENAAGYVFSRGYDYEDVPGYQKYSVNYTFPVSYDNFNIPQWYYLLRAYGNIFYDSTSVNGALENKTLNSYGAELLLESKILRFLPLTVGLRSVKRLLDNENRFEVFVGSSLGL